MKRFISVFLTISILFSLSACSLSSSRESRKTKYVVYKSVSFPKNAYVFENDFKKQDEGNYKCIFIDKLKDIDEEISYNDIETDDTGTYRWYKENKTLTISPDAFDYSSDMFLFDDYLIPGGLVDMGVEYQRQGEFITASGKVMFNVWDFYSNGRYRFTFTGDDSLRSDFGRYYIKDNFIYLKCDGEEEYTISAMLLNDKLLIFDLGYTAYKLEK